MSFVGVAEAASREGAQSPTAARQEGKVAIYTNPTQGPLQPTLKSAFEKQYPGITVEWVLATPSETVSKFLNEYEKGVRSADVIFLGLAGLFDILEKPGSLAKYAPKDTGWLSGDLKDKDGRWASPFNQLRVIAYNTKLVPRAEAPKSYKDLLDPRWTGKIGTGNPKAAPASAAVWKTMEKQLGEDFIRRLATQKIRYYANTGEALNKGEISIVLNQNVIAVEGNKLAGNPVDWVRMNDNTYLTNPAWIGISANAPHPNAARLYVDFVFSKEGQQIRADAGTIPNMPGLRLSNPDLDLKGKKLIPLERVTDAERDAFLRSFSAKYNLSFP